MDLKRDWRLYLVLSVVVFLSEAIGQRKIPAGFGVIILFPMVYAIIMGLLCNARRFKFIKNESLSRIPSLTMMGIALLAARIGMTAGNNLKVLLTLSLVLVLQELGHFLGTVILSLPVAILLGLGREAVGACFSLAREGQVAIIGERFGLDSPEGRGVLAQYFFGTVVGTLYLGFLAGWVDSLGFFNPLSLAFACGVGSASMMASSAGALIIAHPEMKDHIIAISGVANMLTTVLSLYVSLFISLPLTQRLYAFFDTMRRRTNEKDS